MSEKQKLKYSFDATLVGRISVFVFLYKFIFTDFTFCNLVSFRGRGRSFVTKISTTFFLRKKINFAKFTISAEKKLLLISFVKKRLKMRKPKLARRKVCETKLDCKPKVYKSLVIKISPPFSRVRKQTL